MIIVATDRSPLLSEDSLLTIAQREFGASSSTVRHDGLPTVEFRVRVEAPGEPPFTISKFDQEQLSCDGTEDQNFRVAAAVRSALPSDFPRVVAITDSGSMYVDLTTGITPDMIRNGWRDVSQGGF